MSALQSSTGSNAGDLQLSQTKGRKQMKRKLHEEPPKTAEVARQRNLVIDAKRAKLEQLKFSFDEYVTEMFFLQTGGIMVDFASWRKNPENQRKLQMCTQSVKLESDEEEVQSQPKEDQNPVIKKSREPEKLNSSPRKSLSPGLPRSISRQMSTDGTPANKDTIVERAKQEALVMQKVADLRKQGLWSNRRLPKVQEPQRSKCHWDYLLEEMQWLSADFIQERKWKRATARKISKMVQKYHVERQLNQQKAEKEESLKLKRIANSMAKMVREFWQRVEKFIDYKQKTLLDEKRKQCLDEHLNFIVDQTEKYSTWLTEGLQTKSVSSDASGTEDDHEFSPEGNSTDDEETIAEAEKEDEDPSAEVRALEQDSQLPFEELLDSLPSEMLEKPASLPPSDAEDSSTEQKSDEDFTADSSSEDDEKTIAKAEAKEQADHSSELADLQAESELSVEELYAKYAKAYEEGEQPAEVSDGSETETESSSSEDGDDADDEEFSSEEDELSTKELLDEGKQEGEEKEDGPGKEITDIAATAQSLQPTGFTLQTTQVKTTVPFLLKHTLREYQHVGLDWLATLHDSRLNGILADEMGLGKTIQTIALLAHLACDMGVWGPHLIVVPTSVMLNWELELKKWCPGFKILTYYGSQKERKAKRVGWTKCNAFHVCITSYKLAIQDHNAFRRKKWRYFILDEAQNIKNFKSQRWQTLLNFNSQRRLLLTGTPLQNNLMELWSLMHFLMPHVFQSHKEFKEWFANPLTGMIEGQQEYNESVVKRLHKVLRPFLLRRLKKDVEKQMPQKYEHVVMCPLSKRQRFLYDDFMSQRSTKETLASGHFMSVINILMQLRKVCNHPNLFDPRPTVSPFVTDNIVYRTASLLFTALIRDRSQSLSGGFGPGFADLECTVGKRSADRTRDLRATRRLIEEVDSLPDQPTRPRPVKLKFSNTAMPHSNKTSKPPAPKASNSTTQSVNTTQPEQLPGYSPALKAGASLKSVVKIQPVAADRKHMTEDSRKANESEALSRSILDKVTDKSLLRLESILESKKRYRKDCLHQMSNINQQRCSTGPIYGQDLRKMLDCVECQFRPPKSSRSFRGYGYVQCWHAQNSRHRLHRREMFWTLSKSLINMVRTTDDHLSAMQDVLDRFIMYVPNVHGHTISMHISHPHPDMVSSERVERQVIRPLLTRYRAHPSYSLQLRMQVQFPETRLIQYDCGKLQTLALLLRRLKTEGHRVLIFTQMTKMLDVLEQFLNFHGYIYCRLDGTTKIEHRQALMDQFNEDSRIFCFILSTRSGGIGVNLTGADTVIFYDSDWNPTMDAQAQDRCHRIGQTRDVHIYRLISGKTIEENILKKANQKRMLSEVSIEGGNFTTAFFKEDTLKELFEEPSGLDDLTKEKPKEEAEKPKPAEPRSSRRKRRNEQAASGKISPEMDENQLEKALNFAEDEQDIIAADKAKAEQTAELAEFDESIPWDEQEAEAQRQQAMTQAQQEINALQTELSPVEQYAVAFLETNTLDFTAEQMKEAEDQLEAVKRDWELGHLKTMKEEEELRLEYDEDEMLFTYSRDDATTKYFISNFGDEVMPMWSPPTPPHDDNDLYVEPCAGMLYGRAPMTERELPPVHYRRESSRRSAGSHLHDHPRMSQQQQLVPSSKRPKLSREEMAAGTQRSLFSRPLFNPQQSRRKDQRILHKSRDLFPQFRHKNPTSVLSKQQEPIETPDWLISEDWALLQTMQNLMSVSMSADPNSSHSPNWEIVSDAVNSISRIYRPPKQCKNRYENFIVPREEGKILYEVPNKKKKNQKGNIYKTKVQRAMSTNRLFVHDNNWTLSNLYSLRFESVKNIASRRPPLPRSVVNQTDKRGKGNLSVLDGTPISYDKPKSAIEVATIRADRIARDKKKAQDQQLQAHRAQQPTVSIGQTVTLTAPQSHQAVTTLRTTRTAQELQVSTAAALGRVTSATGAPSIGVIAGLPVSQFPRSATTGQLQAHQIQGAKNIPQSSLQLLMRRSQPTAKAKPNQTPQARTVNVTPDQIRQRYPLQTGSVTSAALATIGKSQTVSIGTSSANVTLRGPTIAASALSGTPVTVSGATVAAQRIPLTGKVAGTLGAASNTVKPTEVAILRHQAAKLAQPQKQVATLVKTAAGSPFPSGVSLPVAAASVAQATKVLTPQQMQKRHALLRQQQQKISGQQAQRSNLIVQPKLSVQQIHHHLVKQTDGQSSGTATTVSTVPSTIAQIATQLIPGATKSGATSILTGGSQTSSGVTTVTLNTHGSILPSSIVTQPPSSGLSASSNVSVSLAGTRASTAPTTVIVQDPNAAATTRTSSTGPQVTVNLGTRVTTVPASNESDVSQPSTIIVTATPASSSAAGASSATSATYSMRLRHK